MEDPDITTLKIVQKIFQRKSHREWTRCEDTIERRRKIDTAKRKITWKTLN